AAARRRRRRRARTLVAGRAAPLRRGAFRGPSVHVVLAEQVATRSRKATVGAHARRRLAPAPFDVSRRGRVTDRREAARVPPDAPVATRAAWRERSASPPPTSTTPTKGACRSSMGASWPAA